MTEVKWIKIATDIFDDEKILLIEAMPDADAIIVIWFKLLTLAGKQNNQGIFLMNDVIPYTDEMLATIFRRPLNTVRLALKTFEQFGMISIIENTITIPKWEKHQNIEGLEKIREQTRERVARYRERQKTALLTAEEECNVTVACSNETDKEEDKKKNKKKNKNKNKELYTTEFDQLWNLYPKKQGKQTAYKAYEKARKEGVPYEEVENGIKAYAEYVKGKDSQYIKMGSSFFNQRAWQDDWSINSGHTGFNGFDFESDDNSGADPFGWDNIFG